jgi:hypothetical protein
MHPLLPSESFLTVHPSQMAGGLLGWFLGCVAGHMGAVGRVELPPECVGDAVLETSGCAHPAALPRASRSSRLPSISGAIVMVQSVLMRWICLCIVMREICLHIYRYIEI